VTIEELARMDLVTLHRNRSRSRRWLEARLGERGLSPRIRVEIGATDAIVPLVADGAGYALWWTPMPATGLGECVLRPLVPELRRPIIISHRSGIVSPAAGAFLQLVGAGPQH
jgi:DNA-binding transcriptional LysR family regulator